jgi:hypothetical protein
VAPPPPPLPPAPWEQGPPDSVVAIIIVSILASTAVLFPIARALGRRLDRKAAVPAQNPEMASRLERIEQAVDSIAIEVERISEGQRFTTKMLGERVPSRCSRARACARRADLPRNGPHGGTGAVASPQ